MRNIKFRFYDKENKTMNYCDLEDLCEDDYWFDSETEVWTALHDSNNEQEKFVAMQYTGLKDKNSKEIYENMIINNKYIVIFDFCKFALKNKDDGEIIDFERNEDYEVTGEYFK